MSTKTLQTPFVVSSNVASKQGATLKVVSFKLSQAGVNVLTTSSEAISRARPKGTDTRSKAVSA